MNLTEWKRTPHLRKPTSRTIDTDFIETIAEADPHWDGHILCVSGMPDAIGPRAQRLSACAQDPKVHSDAMVERRDLLPNADRWLFIGLSRLVQMVRVDPAMTDCYLHGSSKLDVATWKHVCISGIAAYVAGVSDCPHACCRTAGLRARSLNLR